MRRAVQHGSGSVRVLPSPHAPGDGRPGPTRRRRRLSKTLVVINSRQERLTLGVDVPAGKSAEATAADLLDEAGSEYRISDR